MVPQKRRENTLTSSQTHVLIWGVYEQTNNSRKLQSGSFPIKMCITTMEKNFSGELELVRLEAFAQLMWNEPKVSSGNPEKCRNPTALLVYLCHMTKKWPYLGHVMKEEQKKKT